MLPQALRARLTVSRRGLLSIILGTFCGQLLTLAVAPLLSRLYDPADFGLFTIASTLAATVSTVAALRYELAVPLPRAESDAYSLVFLGLFAAAGTAMLGTLAVALFGGWIAAVFDEPGLRPWLWAVPWISALMAAVVVLNQFAARNRRYSSIGRRNLFQASAMVAVQLAAGVAGLKSGGMILGYGAGQAAAAASLMRNGELGGVTARAGLARERLRDCAVTYRRFPLLLAPSGLLNILGGQLPVLLIAYWYGAEVAGWLGLTLRVLAMPAALIGAAVAQVYLAEFSRSARSDPDRAREIFRRGSRSLALAATLGGVAVLATGPQVFALVFGERWATSGSYAQALALSMATQFVAAPLSQTLIVLDRQGMQFAWDAGRVTVVSGAVALVAVAGWSDRAAVWAFGLTSALCYLLCWLAARYAVDVRARTASPRPPVSVGVPSAAG
ncbi:lipopolysaccharide biosynthesis protein [Micromonospora mangrovi]|uniref:Oligosaccharide flippase family protein n=2 Tax=Micromonospora TaxID=1873 RepID=A0AAU8HL43_9ACTN